MGKGRGGREVSLTRDMEAHKIERMISAERRLREGAGSTVLCSVIYIYRNNET